MRLVALAGLLFSLLIAATAVLWVKSWTPAQTAAEQSKEVAKNQIVIAAENLRFGEKLNPNNLKVIDWFSETLPAGAIQTIEEIKITKDGPYLTAAVPSGSPLLRSRLSAPGQKPGLSSLLSDGGVAVTIKVNTITGVAGFVLPDERVDIFLTRGANGQNYTDIILENVRVLAVDSAIETATAGTAVQAKSVTFEVTREGAQKLVLAQNLGNITLALRNLSATPYEAARRVTSGEVVTGRVAGEPAADVEEEIAEPAAKAAIVEVRVIRALATAQYPVPIATEAQK